MVNPPRGTLYHAQLAASPFPHRPQVGTYDVDRCLDRVGHESIGLIHELRDDYSALDGWTDQQR
jgi:hypothetical protein